MMPEFERFIEAKARCFGLTHWIGRPSQETLDAALADVRTAKLGYINALAARDDRSLVLGRLDDWGIDAVLIHRVPGTGRSGGWMATFVDKSGFRGDAGPPVETKNIMVTLAVSDGYIVERPGYLQELSQKPDFWTHAKPRAA